LNLTIGQIQTQFTKLKDKIEPSSSFSFSPHSNNSNNINKQVNTNQNTTSGTPQPPQPVPPKSINESYINEEIHKLIKVRTNKKLRKVPKNLGYSKINKKDNFFNYFQYEESGSIKYMNK